jgi:hypothetical protein
MTSTAPPPTAPAEPSRGKSLLARVIGVFVSPRATYADVAAHPRWFGVMALGILLVAGSTFAFLSTEVGQQAVLDQQAQVLESFGVRLNEAQQQQMESRMGSARYTSAVSQIVIIPLSAAVAAGILLGIFTALLGGDATFKQVYSVVAHSGLIIALQTLFSLPLDYARETMSSPTNLAVFAPFLDEQTFLARLLGSIDLFHIWAIVSLAIGLGVLYRRKTGPIALSFFVVYFVVLLTIAAARTALSS